MTKYSTAINEKTKSRIIEILMNRDITFSELMRKLEARDNGQINYHLKVLINQGLVSKIDKVYSLTSLGENLGIYLKQMQFTEVSPICVVCGLVLNQKGEILLLRRANKPEKGKYGLPGGKIRIGETIFSAVSREVFEETGLKLKAKKVIGFFPSLVYKNKKLNFHAFIVPVLMDKLKNNQVVKVNDEHDDSVFVNLKLLHKYPIIKNNLEAIKGIKNKGFIFKEKRYG